MRAAYAEVMAGAKANGPQARITGVSVQEMVGQGVEVIRSCSTRRAQSRKGPLPCPVFEE